MRPVLPCFAASVFCGAAYALFDDARLTRYQQLGRI